MKTMLEHLQEVQRRKFCKDGCENCRFCDGKAPHYCPIDGHMTKSGKEFSHHLVD